MSKGLQASGRELTIGRKNYVGPVRALTKWTAGVEINVNATADGGGGRHKAVQAYMAQDSRRSKGMASSKERSGGHGLGDKSDRAAQPKQTKSK